MHTTVVVAPKGAAHAAGTLKQKLIVRLSKKKKG